jgi:hypothetical protein
MTDTSSSNQNGATSPSTALQVAAGAWGYKPAVPGLTLAASRRLRGEQACPQASCSRRTFLKAAAMAGLAGPFVITSRARAASRASIDSVAVISQQPHFYHGWPTLARRKNGELLLVCSGGREAHVCPFGWVELLRSSDGGQSWKWPQVLIDSAIDDRDAGVLETARGSILVTTFSSLAFEPILDRAESLPVDAKDAWPQEQLRRWQSARHRLPAEQRRGELGVWMIRSTDGGANWSHRYRCQVNSPHGPIQLADGRLLYAGKELWGQERVGVCESTDDGVTWRWLAEIPAREGDDPHNYHELHAVETAAGQIVVQLRNHNRANERETLQCTSSDGGRSWSRPQPIGVWGLPSHLLRLKDDRLLMTYGHRRPPLGNQARLSADHGQTWSEPIVLSGDGTSGDLGYPSTVQLDDGSLVTVWYELLRDSPRAVLRQARWRLV